MDRDRLPAATALRPRWMPPKPSSSRICGPAALEGKLPINALVPHFLLALGSPTTTWPGRAVLADWPACCPWRLARSLPLVPARPSVSCAGASRRPAPRKEQFLGELKPGASAVRGDRKTCYPADGPSVDPASSAPESQLLHLGLGPSAERLCQFERQASTRLNVIRKDKGARVSLPIQTHNTGVHTEVYYSGRSGKDTVQAEGVWASSWLDSQGCRLTTPRLLCFPPGTERGGCQCPVGPDCKREETVTHAQVSADTGHLATAPATYFHALPWCDHHSKGQPERTPRQSPQLVGNGGNVQEGPCQPERAFPNPVPRGCFPGPGAQRSRTHASGLSDTFPRLTRAPASEAGGGILYLNEPPRGFWNPLSLRTSRLPVNLVLEPESPPGSAQDGVGGSSARPRGREQPFFAPRPALGRGSVGGPQEGHFLSSENSPTWHPKREKHEGRGPRSTIPIRHERQGDEAGGKWAARV